MGWEVHYAPQLLFRGLPANPVNLLQRQKKVWDARGFLNVGSTYS